MKKVLTAITLLWMGVIFMLSNTPSTESNSLSKGVLKTVFGEVIYVFNMEVDTDELVVKLNTPIRKVAHFTEYMVLGILMFFTLRFYGVKSQYIAAILCVLYASSDEFHQLFVDGRTGRVLDVIIDSCGSSSGILLCSIVHKLFY